MDSSLELYHEEIKRLKQFRSKLSTNTIYKEDLEEFSNEYEELIAQTKVITRVSDRLQKKLDTANQQISLQNEEIKATNRELRNTVYKLAEARIGKKASTIMTATALILFFLEQYFLQPAIEESIPLSYSFFSILMLILVFFLVKFLESGLEKYFFKQEKRRILLEKKNTPIY
jgi:predicted RNA-binding Zn ribbon-like protein